MKQLVRALIMVPFTVPVVLAPFGFAARFGLCFVAMATSQIAVALIWPVRAPQRPSLPPWW
jgi:hypothetical protein